MREQLTFLDEDVGVMMNWVRWRWLTCWLRMQFWAVACYRIERGLYLESGRWWPVVRHLTRPLFAVNRPGTIDIRPEAVIGPGLLISHPALGVVISYHATLGERVILTGGNCIGTRSTFRSGGELVIGSNVDLGANAIVLGPVRIGEGVLVGAGAVVTRDVPDGATVRMSAATIREAA